MTEAEIMEQITKKRATLEQYRATNPPVSSSLVKALEDEIKQLETSIAGSAPAPKKRRTAFLDECAG